jgi:hypothetical protein
MGWTPEGDDYERTLAVLGALPPQEMDARLTEAYDRLALTRFALKDDTVKAEPEVTWPDRWR